MAGKDRTWLQDNRDGGTKADPLGSARGAANPLTNASSTLACGWETQACRAEVAGTRRGSTLSSVIHLETRVWALCLRGVCTSSTSQL